MTQQTLNHRLSELHAERLRRGLPKSFKETSTCVGASLRPLTVRPSLRSATFIKVGDLVPDAVVREVEGEPLQLSTLLRKGPVVMVVFRSADCPACNIALPHYQEALWPGLRQRGVQLVALSPQIPERLGEIKRRHALDFQVANDVDNALARAFGITFEPDEAAKAETRAKGGAPITDTPGASTWKRPMPAVIAVDQERRARFVDISLDWSVRTEAQPVLAAVDALTRAPADA